MDIIQKISPRPSFPKRGIIPPFVKGRLGGILKINVFFIIKLLIIPYPASPIYIFMTFSRNLNASSLGR